MKKILTLTIALIVFASVAFATERVMRFPTGSPTTVLGTDTTASDLPIADAGTIITAEEVEGALQENRTAINLNTSKVTESTTATSPLVLTTFDIAIPAATNAAAGHASAAHITAIEANTLKDTNVSTTLSAGTVTATTYGITSDGGANDIVLPEADTDNAGLLGADKWDEIVANTLKETNTDTQDLGIDGNNVTLVDGGTADISTTTAVTANSGKTTESTSVTTPITLDGVSVGIVNQGTTTQVLHGNEAGNASFGAIVDDDVPDDITITEQDTLDTVSDRGATTDKALTTGGIVVGDGNTVGTTTNKWLFDDTNGDISTTGNVGIGTTTPNQLLTIEGTLSLKEQASANADTAAYGQLWVKTATPNELWFTDDGGTDTQLGAGGAGDLKADGSVPLTADWDVGAYDITAVEFKGALKGNADTVTTITGLPPDTATTQATQGSITSIVNLATVGTITTGTWNALFQADLIDDDDIDNTADVMSGSFGITIDGGGSAITTGVKGFIEVPYAMTIDRVTVLLDQSGSIVVDIWKDTYANYPPTDADSITSSTPPTVTTATKSEDTTLTSWTTSVTAGDIIGFSVDSVTTATRAHIIISGDKL